MEKREWKQDAERNADKSWKETITSYHFPFFGLMTDLGSTIKSLFLVSITLSVDDNSVHLQIKNEQTDMGKNELYVLIAVFVLLTVIIVWFGAKCINDIRNRKKQQEKRRQEWQAKIRGQRQANG